MTNYFALVLSVTPLSLGQTARAADVEKKSGETDAQFVERITKLKVYDGDDGKPQLARTDKLRAGQGALVAFTEFNADDDDHSVYDLQLNLITEENGKVTLASVPDACEMEGGSPALRAFFFANADGEPDLEIGVICGWPEHKYADCPSFDQARFFKVIREAHGFGLKRVENRALAGLYHQRKKHGGITCDGAPNFRNVADVKRLLSKMKF